MALVVVLMVLVVISVMGLSLMGLAASNIKMSTGERNNQSAYYIAESGITYMLNNITSKITGVYNNSKKEDTFFSNAESLFASLSSQPPYQNFDDHFGKKPEVKVTIEKIANGNSNSLLLRDYKIISVGTIDNRSRTVEKQFQLAWIPKTKISLPNTALFVDDSINLSGSASISGGIGTNSSAAGSITLTGGANISGDIYVGPNPADNVINKDLNNKVIIMNTIKNFELPEFPMFPSYAPPPNEKVYSNESSYDVIYDGSLRVDSWIANNYTLNMQRDLSFTNITLNSNNTLYINVGSVDRNIVVDNLNVQNGTIKLIGSGKLTIYIKNTISMGSGSVINTTDEIENYKGNEVSKLQLIENQVKKLNIFYKGASLSLSGGQKIYGSLYAQNADISLSGGSGFQGHILTGGEKVTISGGANAYSQIFYAPNADVIVSGGGEIKGSIVSKTYTASGGSSLIFEKVDNEDLPPFIGGGSGVSATVEDLLSKEPSLEKN